MRGTLNVHLNYQKTPNKQSPKSIHAKKLKFKMIILQEYHLEKPTTESNLS